MFSGNEKVPGKNDRKVGRGRTPGTKVVSRIKWVMSSGVGKTFLFDTTYKDYGTRGTLLPLISISLQMT